MPAERFAQTHRFRSLGLGLITTDGEDGSSFQDVIFGMLFSMILTSRRSIVAPKRTDARLSSLDGQ
jgi:hypothetical protein